MNWSRRRAICLLSAYITLCIATDVSDYFDYHGDWESCQCTCHQHLIQCFHNFSWNCATECEDRCEADNPVHTLDENGECPSKKNCTCVTSGEWKPICAIHVVKKTFMGFGNTRNMQCHNLCKNKEYVYDHDGWCWNETISKSIEDMIMNNESYIDDDVVRGHNPEDFKKNKTEKN